MPVNGEEVLENAAAGLVSSKSSIKLVLGMKLSSPLKKTNIIDDQPRRIHRVKMIIKIVRGEFLGRGQKLVRQYNIF